MRWASKLSHLTISSHKDTEAQGGQGLPKICLQICLAPEPVPSCGINTRERQESLETAPAPSDTAAMGAMQGPTRAGLTSLNFSPVNGVSKTFNELLFYFTIRPHFP